MKASGYAAVALVIAAACSGGSDITPPGEQGVVTPPGASFSCIPLEMAVGEVRTALAGSNVCLAANGDEQFMLDAFFGSTASAANTSITLTGFGITTGTASGATTSLAASPGAATLGGSSPRESLELSFRNYERNVLQPMMPGVRAASRHRARLANVPATVGSAVTLNGTSTGCSNPQNRAGHVVAVSTRAIVVSDDASPAGGFTAGDFASIAATFDTLVDPLDRAAFGDPTDIDANSHVILFYTPLVNQLTPANSEGVVQGFFNPRDLFPTQTTADFEGCAGSNFAEMFYLMVPDPNGTINDNVRSKSDVIESSIAVVTHEYQHLINASRRMYVNNANDFEEVWLNEGLSHIAEELLFYHTAGLSPRANITANTIRASQTRIDAFNQHQSNNFGRYLEYLPEPGKNSPYAADDSLATRGAIWDFLRYAADRKAPSDGTIWKSLVNSVNSGFDNLEGVFGTDVMTWFRDWSISNYTDDKVSTDPQFQQPSWNFRNIMPALGVATYPLRVQPLTNATAKTVTLVAGGSLYATLGVPAGGTAGISWSGGSSSVTFSIVRTK
jgi:hypothetical protein